MGKGDKNERVKNGETRREGEWLEVGGKERWLRFWKKGTG